MSGIDSKSIGLNDPVALNDFALKSITSLSSKCKQIKFISIIGQKNENNKHIVNCIINHVLVPDNNILQVFNEENKSLTGCDSVEFYSFINPHNKDIGVFLMSIQNEIESISNEACSQIIVLLLKMSSTFIYTIMNPNSSDWIQNLTKRINSNLKLNNDYFIQDVFLLIRDCNEVATFSDGFDAGKKYIEDKLKETSLKEHINICFLIKSSWNESHQFYRHLHCNFYRSFCTGILEFLYSPVLSNSLDVSELNVKTNDGKREQTEVKSLQELFCNHIKDLNKDKHLKCSQSDEFDAEVVKDGSFVMIDDVGLEGFENNEDPQQQDANLEETLLNDYETNANEATDNSIKEETSLIEMMDVNDFVSNELSVATTDTNSMSTSDDKPENKFDENQIMEHLQVMKNICLSIYNDFMRNAINDKKFNVEDDIKEIHDDAHKKAIKQFLDSFVYDSLSEEGKTLCDDSHIKLIKAIEGEFKKYQEFVTNKLESIENELKSIYSDVLTTFEVEMRSKLKEPSINLLKTGLFTIYGELKIAALQVFTLNTREFNTTRLINDYSGKIAYESLKIKGKYDEMIKFCNHYKEDWSKDVNIFMAINQLKEGHQRLKQIYVQEAINKYNDEDLNQFLEKLMEQLFNSYCKLRDKILNDEEEVANNAIDLGIQLFNENIKNLLKSHLYSKGELKVLLEHQLSTTLESVKITCNFYPQQSHLIEKIDNKFAAQIDCNLIVSQYMDKNEKMKKLFSNSIKEAKTEYRNGMIMNSSQKTRLINEHLESSHQICLQQAIHSFNKETEKIKSEFGLNPKLALNLIHQNKFELRKGVDKMYERFIVENERKPWPQKSPDVKLVPQKEPPKSEPYSIGIYFGSQNIVSSYFDHKSDEILPIKADESLTRPNCIAINNEKILIGSDAQKYVKENHKQIFSFDVRKLLARDSQSVTQQEMNSYPFNIKEKDGKYIIDAIVYNKQREFHVETLIALQLIRIKNDAEKQLGEVSSYVLTAPYTYTMRQKNALKNASLIAGMQPIEILSELSAAALGFAADPSVSIGFSYNVILVVILDGNEFDIAQYIINKNRLIMIAHFHDYFISNKIGSKETGEYNANEKNAFTQNTDHLNDKNIFVKTKKKFSQIKGYLYQAFNKTDPRITASKIIITGESLWMPQVERWGQEYFGTKTFNSKLFKYKEPLELMSSGACFYASMKRNPKITVQELNYYNIYYRVNNNEKQTKIFSKYNQLPLSVPLKQSIIFQPQIEVSFYEDRKNLSTFQHLKRLSSSQNQKLTLSQCCAKFIIPGYSPPTSRSSNNYSSSITLFFDSCGDLQIRARIISGSLFRSNLPASDTRIHVQKYDCGLTSQELQQQCNQLESMRIQEEQMQNTLQKNRELEEAINDLKGYVEEVKERLQTEKIRAVRKVRIEEEELPPVELFLESNPTQLKQIKEIKENFAKCINNLIGTKKS